MVDKIPKILRRRVRVKKDASLRVDEEIKRSKKVLGGNKEGCDINKLFEEKFGYNKLNERQLRLNILAMRYKFAMLILGIIYFTFAIYACQYDLMDVQLGIIFIALIQVGLVWIVVGILKVFREMIDDLIWVIDEEDKKSK